MNEMRSGRFQQFWQGVFHLERAQILLMDLLVVVLDAVEDADGGGAALLDVEALALPEDRAHQPLLLPGVGFVGSEGPLDGDAAPNNQTAQSKLVEPETGCFRRPKRGSVECVGAEATAACDYAKEFCTPEDCSQTLIGPGVLYAHVGQPYEASEQGILGARRGRCVR